MNFWRRRVDPRPLSTATVDEEVGSARSRQFLNLATYRSSPQ
jgi:hypothetical protein